MVASASDDLLDALKYAPKEHRRDVRLSTSFSDLRYYLECPHDFYLRKVLGFAPTIDQAFGYGRGVHNLMRAIHADPKKWAALAADRKRLEREVQRLLDQGLFYLRYTTGDPAQNMRAKGLKIVADYVQRYAAELGKLTFEPEKEFETLIEYEDGSGGVLVSGAIDIVRQDDPPRVTLIDFKSGDPDSDRHQKLDEEEMKLQVSLYAVAAKKELEYQPEQDWSGISMPRIRRSRNCVFPWTSTRSPRPNRRAPRLHPAYGIEIFIGGRLNAVIEDPAAWSATL